MDAQLRTKDEFWSRQSTCWIRFT